MGNLYLISRKPGEEALAICQQDKDGQVVLLQDAVYLVADGFTGAQVYALKWDVDVRGLGQHLPPMVKLISYHELIDLILANKVVNLT